jgi:hypothetical protein
MTFGLFKGFHGLGKSGGLFDKAGFGKSGWGKSGWGRDDDCDRDDDHGHGHGHGHGGGHGDGGSGSGGGQGFPAIAADTAGITFHVDLNGDGTMDDYLPVGAADTGASGTPTFADYYASASDDLAAEHPGADPAQVIVKATIYGPNGEESYYEFTGLEGDDDGDDDGGDCDRDDDRGHGRDHDRDDDHDRDWGHGKGHGGTSTWPAGTATTATMAATMTVTMTVTMTATATATAASGTSAMPAGTTTPASSSGSPSLSARSAKTTRPLRTTTRTTPTCAETRPGGPPCGAALARQHHGGGVKQHQPDHAGHRQRAQVLGLLGELRPARRQVVDQHL